MGKLILFVDDTTLLESHRNKRHLSFAVEHDFVLLIDWFRVNKLSLNIAKTVTMEFWLNKNGRCKELKLTGHKIPIVEHTKFLGVYLDEYLN